MHANLEQKFGLAQSVAVSQCLIHDSRENIIPLPPVPSACAAFVPHLLYGRAISYMFLYKQSVF